MSILPNPIANLDSDGRLVKLHCGTPVAACNIDDPLGERTMTWAEALSLLRLLPRRYSLEALCVYCFGGEGA